MDKEPKLNTKETKKTREEELKEAFVLAQSNAKERIKKEEERGKSLSDEEKKNIGREEIERAMKEYHTQQVKESGIGNILEKSQKWWDKIGEKKHNINFFGKSLEVDGRVVKTLLSSAFSVGGIVAGSYGLNMVLTKLNIGLKLASRVGIATGVTYFFTRENKKQEVKTEIPKKENWFSNVKKLIKNNPDLIKYGTMGMGVGASFIFSGGLMVGVVGCGMALKLGNEFWAKIDSKKEELKKEQLFKKKELKNFTTDLDIEKLAQNLNVFYEEYAKISKKLSIIKTRRGLLNGAITMATGIGAIAAHDTHSASTETQQDSSSLKIPKVMPKTPHQTEIVSENHDFVKEEMTTEEKIDTNAIITDKAVEQDTFSTTKATEPAPDATKAEKVNLEESKKAIENLGNLGMKPVNLGIDPESMKIEQEIPPVTTETPTETPEETPQEQTVIPKTEKVAIEENAVVYAADSKTGMGGGITYSYLEQLKDNPELCEKLGIDHDKLNDPNYAAQKTAEIAVKNGYLEKVTNENGDVSWKEVRVLHPDKSAYVLTAENGQPVTTEYQIEKNDDGTYTGTKVETHHSGDKFEPNTTDGIEKEYEYSTGKEYHYGEKITDQPVQKTLSDSPIEKTQAPQKIEVGPKDYAYKNVYDSEEFKKVENMSNKDFMTKGAENLITTEEGDHLTGFMKKEYEAALKVDPDLKNYILNHPNLTNKEVLKLYQDIQNGKIDIKGEELLNTNTEKSLSETLTGQEKRDFDYINSRAIENGYYDDLNDNALKDVSDVYKHNVETIFHDRDDWNDVKDDPVSRYLKMDENKIEDPKTLALVHHLHELKEKVGLEPLKETGLFGHREDVDEYMARSLLEAKKAGIDLDKLKIQEINQIIIEDNKDYKGYSPGTGGGYKTSNEDYKGYGPNKNDDLYQ